MAGVVEVLANGLTHYYQGSKRRQVSMASNILLALAVLLILGFNACVAANSHKTVKLVSRTNKYLTVVGKSIKGHDKDSSAGKYLYW